MAPAEQAQRALVRRSEDALSVDTNFGGLSLELNQRLNSSAALLQETQNRCREVLLRVPAELAARPTDEMAYGWRAPSPAGVADIPLCCPQSPVSYPSRRRPAAWG